jgi:hypothetical protein
MTPANKWTVVFDEKASPKIVSLSLNGSELAVRSFNLEQVVGKPTVLKLEVFIHNDTLETIHL